MGAPVVNPPVPPPTTSGRPPSGSRVLSTLDYLLRLAFFATAPFVLVAAALLLPMTGAIITMLLAFVGIFFAELLLKASNGRAWLRPFVAQPLAFEAYYREHPPRPFLYYVFYPLLFPYWLAVKKARAEFLLYRGYTVATLLILVVMGAFRYFNVYRPEISFRHFAVAFVIGLVVESLAVFAFVMPMTTSVITLHQRKQYGRLTVLVLAGVVSAGACAYAVNQRRHVLTSLEARRRIQWRTKADPVRAQTVRDKAIRLAWASRRAREPWGREKDGNVVGEPLDTAREALGSFYRADEAAGFELWTSARTDKVQVMVLYAEGWRRGSPVFYATRSDGTRIEKLSEIPAAARRVMRTAGDF